MSQRSDVEKELKVEDLEDINSVTARDDQGFFNIFCLFLLNFSKNSSRLLANRNLLTFWRKSSTDPKPRKPRK